MKYTLSVSVKSAVLKNITLIVISFFIICPPAKRAFCKLFKKLAQKSQAAYGRVMITKTIMTVLVFCSERYNTCGGICGIKKRKITNG